MEAQRALLAIAALAWVTSPSVAESPVVFAGETTIHSDGSHYGVIFSNGDTLTSVDLATESPRAAFFIQAPGGGSTWLLKGGGEMIGGDPVYLPVGAYFVYLVTDPPAHATVALTFESSSGSASIPLRSETRSAIRELPQVGPGGPTGRFSLGQPFEGDAATWLFTAERYTADAARIVEWRIESSGGILSCYSRVDKSGPPAREVSGLFSVYSAGGPLRVSYYRDATPGVASTAILGMWIERAPDDIREVVSVLRPPGWGITEGNPLLDHDALCGKATAGVITRHVEPLTLPGSRGLT